uniref:Kinesin-like protein KIF18B n=1 Tax=Cacopsylla melanoneura TaxID=428564 RepID=A0A8D8YWB5_9HEMI
MVLGRRDIERAFSPRVSKVRPRSNSASKSLGEQSPMKVFIRVRPHNQKELEGGHRDIFRILNHESVIFDPKQDESDFFFHGVKQSLRDVNKKKNKEMEFLFDRVYGPDASNQDVFDGSAKDIIASLLEGYNCSVFVYGATGAGKTHTMLGNENHKGIMYLTMVDLYRHMDANKDTLNIELGISYLEVYNENVQDLLNPDKKSLHLREDTHGVVVAGMKLEVIHNADHLFELLQKGNNNRTQHPTDANAESSRSHAVFQVYVKMQDKSSQQMKMVKLSMIDLAGSERAAANSSNVMRFKEGSNINKSLLALGNCINSLADGCRHVPYRDSKLTRLLKDSLGGNCKTIMIANIGPTANSYEDSYNTLKYATRAKKIKAKLTKNIVSMEMHSAEYKKYVENIQTKYSSLEQENERLTQKVAQLEEAMNVQDFKNNRLNVDPQRKEMKTMFDEKKQLVTELYSCNSQKLSLKWRIQMKQMISSYLSEIEKEQLDVDPGDVTCLQQDVKRIEASLSQFDGRIKSLDEKMKSLLNRESQINNNINNWKQNLGAMVYESLKPEMDIYVLEMDNIKYRLESDHSRNLNSMLCSLLKSHKPLLTEVSVKLMNYYFLIKVYGKMDRSMRDEHMGLVKKMKGIKNIKWLDDVDEDHDDDLKTYCCLDPISFENDASAPSLLSPPDLSSPNEGETVANTTLTLSSASTPPIEQNSGEVKLTPSLPTVVSHNSNTQTKPATVTTKVNTVPASVKSIPGRPPLSNSTMANRNRPVIKTPVRPLNKVGLNKENIPSSNILSKLNENKTKPRFIPGGLKTPRDKAGTNNIYLRKTPAPISDPTLVNRARQALGVLNSDGNYVYTFDTLEDKTHSPLSSRPRAFESANLLKSINEKLY